MKLLNYKQEVVDFQENHKDDMHSLAFGKNNAFSIDYLNNLLRYALIGQRFYDKINVLLNKILGDVKLLKFFGTVRTTDEIVNLCKELLNY